MIPPQGCTQSARSKSEAYGTFGSNQSGLNADLFLRKIMNKKRGQKREIKEYHSFELVIAVGLLVYWSVGLLVVGHSYIWWLLKEPFV